MEAIIEECKQLIETLYSKKDSYPEDELVIFTPAKGATYNTELMIVGRAVNDWKNQLNKHDSTNSSVICDGVWNCLYNDNLEWVESSWGISGNEYNTKKSAFWRVAKALAIQFAEIEAGAIHNIVWSNLYKVAKSGGGNPSAALKQVQFEHCLNLLRLELELLKPKYVIFLTDYYGWAEPFVKGLNAKKMMRSDEGFVKFTGTYNASNIVVACHPQGKQEEPHIQAIMDANETFKLPLVV